MAINEKVICFGNKLCNFTSYGVSHKWLFNYIQSPEFFSNFSSNMSGIIGGVGVSKLKDMFIPVAPTNEIANITQLVDLMFERLSQLE
jgi:type I restriction enzyme S subunit